MPLIRAMIDSGPLIAFYYKGDKWHGKAQTFFANFKGKLFTSESVVAEVMWQLAADWRMQNAFLSDLQNELYKTEPLGAADFKHIAELNEKYKDRPAHFADLSIVAICERLNVLNVVSLDADFDVYRTITKKTFKQLFPKWDLPTR